MPTVTNISSDDLNMPSVGGLSLLAGEATEVDEFVASELYGHPLLRVDGWEPPFGHLVVDPPAAPDETDEPETPIDPPAEPVVTEEQA